MSVCEGVTAIHVKFPSSNLPSSSEGKREEREDGQLVDQTNIILSETLTTRPMQLENGLQTSNQHLIIVAPVMIKRYFAVVSLTFLWISQKPTGAKVILTLACPVVFLLTIVSQRFAGQKNLKQDDELWMDWLQNWKNWIPVATTFLIFLGGYIDLTSQKTDHLNNRSDYVTQSVIKC